MARSENNVRRPTNHFRVFNSSYVGARKDVAELIPLWCVNILDLGCATGELGAAIRATNPGSRVTGVELDAEMAAIASTKLDLVVQGDVSQLSAMQSQLGREPFDAVICADVLEHLPDPWRVVRELGQLMTPTGALIVSIPNVGHIDTFINLLVRRRWPYRDRGIHDSTHLRFFALENVLALLNQAGFEIRRLERNLRLVEEGSRLDRLAVLLAFPPLRDLVTFQFLVLARRSTTTLPTVGRSTMPRVPEAEERIPRQ